VFQLAFCGAGVPPACLCRPDACTTNWDTTGGSLLFLQLRGDVVQNRLLVGELSGFQFRVDQLAVDGHFKTPAACGNKREILELLLEAGEQFGRQTDGLRFVPSERTVFQFDVHDVPPVGKIFPTAF
jgi:hypothetical protein